jgi:hypothetical protein
LNQHQRHAFLQIIANTLEKMIQSTELSFALQIDLRRSYGQEAKKIGVFFRLDPDLWSSAEEEAAAEEDEGQPGVTS